MPPIFKSDVIIANILTLPPAIESFVDHHHTQSVTGSLLKKLPSPWGKLLNEFLDKPDLHLYKQYVDVNGSDVWVNLHKSSHEILPEHDQVIVLEDATDLQLLEHELTHSERLASIGRLAAGVAHEIGNPVTGIACLAQNLHYDTENPESLETADAILQQTDRISKIVQTLVNFAHAGTNQLQGEPEPVNIYECAEEAIHLLALNKDAKTINFQNHCHSDSYALGDNQRILQILVNLLSNARDASPELSEVSVSTQPQDSKLLISVTDQGSGISAEHQEQIFDPFFTTKEAGAGTGLGLSLVYSIVEDMDGSIQVESPVAGSNVGTRFTVTLPAATQTA